MRSAIVLLSFLLWRTASLFAQGETPILPSQYPTQDVPMGSSTSGVTFSKARFNDPFLSRYDVPYINYGWIDYRNYKENIPIYKRYDFFGNYLAEGWDVYRLEEFRTRAPEEGSFLLKGRFYQNWLSRLIIADDAYAGWTTRVTVGDAIRTTFTPLTLDIARMDGIRWDGASADNRFTVVISRVSDPLKLNPFQNLLGDAFESRRDGVYLMGGHWQTYIGDFLNVGATYVNMHRFDSLRDLSGNSRKGVAPTAQPIQIVVRFEDDSPEDGIGGAAVFDLMGVVKTKEGKQVVTQTMKPSETRLSSGAVSVGRHVEASGEFVDQDGVRRPNFIDYVFNFDPSLAAKIVDVKFHALVANDYRISLQQTHVFSSTAGRKNRTPLPYTVRRAEGNVRDLSNKHRMTFTYGMATGLTTYGMDASLQLIGFSFKGEFAKNSSYYQYPVPDGGRSLLDDNAAYLTASRDIGRATLGAELFRVGPKYNSYHPKGENFYFDDKRQDPTEGPGVLVNGGLGDDIQLQPGAGTDVVDLRYSLVDDNDDLDQWPDDWRQDFDTQNPLNLLITDSGIFPAFDFDSDGLPDNNRNNNAIPDYDEPFLMYYVEPDEFQYGDDFNNNGVIDAWEDDDLPNYPYNKDQKGTHFLFVYRPLREVEVSFGRYDVNQIAGGGENTVRYGRLKLLHDFPGKGKVEVYHETKDVRDDIPDNWFRFELAQGIDELAYIPVFQSDPLEMRKSLVNRGMVYTTYAPLSRFTLTGRIRYEVNAQRAARFRDLTSQPEDRLAFLGLVGKADYAYRLQNLTLRPMIKAVYQKQDRRTRERPITERLTVAPIFRADYDITRRSSIQVGFQGFPVVENRIVDYVNRENDRSERHFILLLSNRSEFEGYRLATEIGWQRTSTEFDARNRQDVAFSKFFLRVVAGVGESLK